MRKISKLEVAAVNKSWKGSLPPEDWKKIDDAYSKARLDLVTYIIEHTL
jgi:hypothetical protein